MVSEMGWQGSAFSQRSSSYPRVKVWGTDSATATQPSWAHRQVVQPPRPAGFIRSGLLPEKDVLAETDYGGKWGVIVNVSYDYQVENKTQLPRQLDATCLSYPDPSESATRSWRPWRLCHVFMEVATLFAASLRRTMLGKQIISLKDAHQHPYQFIQHLVRKLKQELKEMLRLGVAIPSWSGAVCWNDFHEGWITASTSRRLNSISFQSSMPTPCQYQCLRWSARKDWSSQWYWKCTWRSHTEYTLGRLFQALQWGHSCCNCHLSVNDDHNTARVWPLQYYLTMWWSSSTMASIIGVGKITRAGLNPSK